jgi:hypothetical protein
MDVTPAGGVTVESKPVLLRALSMSVGATLRAENPLETGAPATRNVRGGADCTV